MIDYHQKPMRKYRYEGHIMSFSRCLVENEVLETRATSIAKARSNFEYQCKKKLNLSPSAKIDLIGTITEID